jgi:hypothetical protein
MIIRHSEFISESHNFNKNYKAIRSRNEFRMTNVGQPAGCRVSSNLPSLDGRGLRGG